MKALLVTAVGQAWSKVLAEDPKPQPEGGGGVTNPLNGVKPDMGVLGSAFGSTWIRVAGAVWAIFIAGAALALGSAFLNMAQAKKLGNANMMSEATGDVKIRAAALGGLVGLPVIVGAIIAVIGS